MNDNMNIENDKLLRFIKHQMSSLLSQVQLQWGNIRNENYHSRLTCCRSLITNLTCPGDNSLYVEWAQPEQYYHGVNMYNLYIKTRQDTEWDIREVVVPPVVKHNVEKVFIN